MYILLNISLLIIRWLIFGHGGSVCLMKFTNPSFEVRTDDAETV